MASVMASGTQSATVGTEHTLTSQTVFRVYQLQVDFSALAAGELAEIRIKTKVLSGSALNTVKLAAIQGGSTQPVFVSFPLASDIQFDATIKQINGTGRTFPWKVIAL